MSLGTRLHMLHVVYIYLFIIAAYVWVGGLMFEVGFYYIDLHETTYCTPTPFFSDTVKYIAMGV